MGSTQLGKYTLTEILGQGGFGTVYLARDGTLEVERAVKVLHPQLAADAVFLERFRREARLAARLEHAHIVPVYELDEAGGSYYLVMRHMAGGSLKELLAREGRLAFAQAAAVVRQIAAALDFAHSQPEPVVHRDIKPGNILFEAGGAVARLSDFGFARAFSGSQSASLSASGAMIGTPAYMAPEVWRNRPVGPAADQYSLACVLYEMLTGDALFGGDSPAAIMTGHVLDGPQFPAAWPEGVPEGIETVLGRALASDLQQRYPTMGAFAGAVMELGRPAMVTEVLPAAQSAEEKEPISAEEQGGADEAAPENVGGAASASPHPLPGAPVGRRRWVVTGIGAVVLLGVLALAVVCVLSLVYGLETMAPEPVSLPTEAPTRTYPSTKAPTRPLLPTMALPHIEMLTKTSGPIDTPDSNLTTGSTRIAEKDKMVQVFVPAGEFWMGAKIGEENEKPMHLVYLEDYWIDQTEVTNAMYRRCVTAQGCKPPSDVTFYNDSEYDQHPVVYVDWYQADSYCRWAERRLPNEAEWEKAARGTDSRAYPWGNRLPDCSVANYWSCGNGLRPAGSLPAGASPYGVLDMSGNVWEWVQDWYESNYYKRSPERNPTGPTNRDYKVDKVDKVVRGGSWSSYTGPLRSAHRYNYDPDNRLYNLGFRCVVSAEK